MINDEALVRLAKQHLYIDERKKLILPLLKRVTELGKEIEDKELFPISLTEERGDMQIGQTTMRILQKNLDRLPDDLRERVVSELLEE